MIIMFSFTKVRTDVPGNNNEINLLLYFAAANKALIVDRKVRRGSLTNSNIDTKDTSNMMKKDTIICVGSVFIKETGALVKTNGVAFQNQDRERSH